MTWVMILADSYIEQLKSANFWWKLIVFEFWGPHVPEKLIDGIDAFCQYVLAGLFLVAVNATGTIGHVAHGKSTVVKAISGVQVHSPLAWGVCFSVAVLTVPFVIACFAVKIQTVRFKNELERNITIKLGYANAKVLWQHGCQFARLYLPAFRAHALHTNTSNAVMLPPLASLWSSYVLVSHLGSINPPSSSWRIFFSFFCESSCSIILFTTAISWYYSMRLIFLVPGPTVDECHDCQQFECLRLSNGFRFFFPSRYTNAVMLGVHLQFAIAPRAVTKKTLFFVTDQGAQELLSWKG